MQEFFLLLKRLPLREKLLAYNLQPDNLYTWRCLSKKSLFRSTSVLRNKRSFQTELDENINRQLQDFQSQVVCKPKEKVLSISIKQLGTLLLPTYLVYLMMFLYWSRPWFHQAVQSLLFIELGMLTKRILQHKRKHFHPWENFSSRIEFERKVLVPSYSTKESRDFICLLRLHVSNNNFRVCSEY